MDPERLPRYKHLQATVADLYAELPLFPEPGSSLDEDDVRIPGTWTVSQMAYGLIVGGVANVAALDRLIASGLVDVWSLWSNARTALESSAQAVWLLHGNREERVLRAARAWADDLDERRKWENSVDWNVPAGGMSGGQRREEFLAEAVERGLDREAVERKPLYVETLEEAARLCGQESQQVVAAWRLASGFAHGKQWPLLRGSNVADAARTSEGTMARFEFDEARFDPLAGHIQVFLDRGAQTYQNRSPSVEQGQSDD